MTTANVTLFFIIVLGTIAFSLFCYKDEFPFKENLKVSSIFGLILGLIFYSVAFQTIVKETATKDDIEWVTLPSDKAKLTSYQSVNKHYKVVKPLNQVTTDDQHWTGKLTIRISFFISDLNRIITVFRTTDIIAILKNAIFQTKRVRFASYATKFSLMYLIKA